MNGEIISKRADQHNHPANEVEIVALKCLDKIKKNVKESVDPVPLLYRKSMIEISICQPFPQLNLHCTEYDDKVCHPFRIPGVKFISRVNGPGPTVELNFYLQSKVTKKIKSLLLRQQTILDIYQMPTESIWMVHFKYVQAYLPNIYLSRLQKWKAIPIYVLSPPRKVA